MNIFKAFGINKHMPTRAEWAKHQQGLSDAEAKQDAIQDFDEDVDPRFEQEPEIKPHMSAHEVRQSGMIPGMKPDPEPGTVSRNVRQRTSGGYPDKEKIIRKPGDYINPPYGESDLDTK